MPINLNALGLIPSTPYNVSITMKVGDKEIDSLRSFSSTTPPIFNKNLVDYAPQSAIITRNFVTTRAARAAQNDVAITGTFKILSMAANFTGKTVEGTKVPKKWSGGGPLNQQAPVIQLKYKLNKDLTNAVVVSSSPSDIAKRYLLTQLTGARTTKKKVVSVNVSAAELGCFWSSIHKEWVGGVRGEKFWSKGNRDKKGFGKYLTAYKGTGAFGGSKDIPAVIGVKSLTSKLRTSVDPAVTQLLVNGEEIKDVIYFLYSDSTSNPPAESSYIYLDSSFVAASGVNTTTQGWTKATGRNFKTGSTYNFPTYSNEEISNRRVISQSLVDTIVFSNTSQQVDSVQGEVDGSLSYPQNVNIAFTIIRYTLTGDSWAPSWIGGETKMSSPTSAVIT
jgi:hypothetical protein